MHALTDIAQKMCKTKTKKKIRTTTNKQTSRSYRDRKWVSRFPWVYLAGYGVKSSPVGHQLTGQKSKSVQKKAHLFILFYFFLTPVASLSLSLNLLPFEFASRSYSTPHKTAVIASLCHIQHHTRWQSLFLCINLSFNKMAVFAPFGYIERHTRW